MVFGVSQRDASKSEPAPQPSQVEMIRQFRKQDARLKELVQNFRTNAKFAENAAPDMTPKDAEAGAWKAAADAVEFILNTLEKGD